RFFYFCSKFILKNSWFVKWFTRGSFNRVIHQFIDWLWDETFKWIQPTDGVVHSPLEHYWTNGILPWNSVFNLDWNSVSPESQVFGVIPLKVIGNLLTHSIKGKKGAMNSLNS
ncbi:hypothetical protein SNEBB_000997, partial [Seison nebaliae]